MLDFGLIDSKDMNDYETKYLTDFRLVMKLLEK
jgi:hypothetical protein